ncbi:sensor histidine kinase [Methylobacterium sp. J-092]|uniref:sensor histidine kinase n=1 Tax=Methylobacterium sp. J-092 TaxID=2836667 RepID=UPI001FB9AB3E|nr:ATP-binding protein [Methylobacterium sp. J-092]MCJ2009594.1 ATP-binding protein [Methylobacterium sp. J-092]
MLMTAERGLGMGTALNGYVDWFLPEAAFADRSQRGVARHFVLTHLFGPLMSQSMCIFLYLTDPSPGLSCYTVIACVSLFWLLPFVLKHTQSIKIAAFVSVELLAFTSLFGAFFYGGALSPCIPWLIIALLLGFFYFSDRQALIVLIFVVNIGLFIIAYEIWGFPETVPLADLAPVSWISIVSATLYMSWMATYYSDIMSSTSLAEREADMQLEQLRAAKERADAANRGRTIFLSKMSHELRTPLNAVIGYSELILESMPPDGGNATWEKDIGRINAAGRHLLSLVADVLDLENLGHETDALRCDGFLLRDMVDQVIATVEPMAQSNKNVLRVVSAALDETLTTDETKLRQILVNLLGNAAKFTMGGSITLAVRRDEKAGVPCLTFHVIDTGIGIAEADAKRLFTDFEQVSAETNHSYGGTGLGLALSQKLCVLLGGSITVRSEVGKGSVFAFRIPTSRVAEDADEGELGRVVDMAPMALVGT